MIVVALKAPFFTLTLPCDVWLCGRDGKRKLEQGQFELRVPWRRHYHYFGRERDRLQFRDLRRNAYLKEFLNSQHDFVCVSAAQAHLMQYMYTGWMMPQLDCMCCIEAFTFISGRRGCDLLCGCVKRALV